MKIRMDDTLVPPYHATDDFQLNWGTVGLPYQMGAEEARATDPSSEAWAVEVAAATTRQLTFRLEPQSNFWIDAISVHLWTVTLDLPGTNKLLTQVDPLTTFAPVFLRAQDSRQDWQRNSMHWGNLGARGLSLQWLGLPQVLYGGNAITMSVENQSADTDYAIAVVLHGRKRRAYRSGGGGFDPVPEPKWMAALTEKQRTGGFGTRIPLADENDQNVRRVGVPHFLAPEGDPNFVELPGTASWTAMARTQTVAYNDPMFTFFCRYARYLCIDDTAEELFQAPPVFVQLTDDRFQYAVSNMPVPVDAAFGLSGGRPYIYPVDWVWERRGSVQIEVYDAFRDDNAHNLWLSFEGWWRRPGEGV